MFRAVMRSSFATRVARVAAAATLGLAIHAVAVPAIAQTAPTTLSFASWQLNEPGNAEWWKAVIAAFEAENKGIKIDPIYVPYASFSTQMTIRFASGRPPAVLQLSEQLFGTYAAQGWLRDIDDRIKGTDFQTDWVSAQKSLTWDGSSRGVILSNSAIMLFYNEKLLADAGVAPPKNWEEFKAAVAKVTKPDAGIFGLSAVTMEHPTVIEDIHRYARWAGTSVVKDGKYNLTSKEFVAAFDAYRTTVGKNAPLGSSSAVGRQLFVDGKTAFLIDGPWVWSWLEKASPAVRPNLKMVRAPFEPQLAPAGITIHMSNGLDKATENAAWTFIDFVTRAKWQRDYILMTGQPAGRVSPVLTEADKAKAPHLAVIAEAASQATPIHTNDQRVRANFAEYSAILMKAGLRAISTADPTTTILAEAQAQLQKAVPLD